MVRFLISMANLAPHFFTKLTRNKSDDGNFEVNEVFGLDIKADIVTLSACQTGLGDLVGGIS